MRLGRFLDQRSLGRFQIGLQVRFHNGGTDPALQKQDTTDDDFLDEQFFGGPPPEFSAHREKKHIAGPQPKERRRQTQGHAAGHFFHV